MSRLELAFALSCAALVGCASSSPAPSKTPTVAPTEQATVVAAAVTPSTTTEPVTSESAPVQPRQAQTPWLQAAPTSDYLLIGQTEQLFGVWVDVPKSTGAHVPTALTLAIDTSGSMRGENIVHAREAALRLLDELEPGDIVSLVTFSDRARVRVPPTTLDESRRRSLRTVVEELSAEGGTAMGDGLRLASAQLWNVPSSHLVRRVVVISDGKATVGIQSPSQLGQIAERGLQQGVQVTALGVGLDYDERTLNELALRSSGRLYHVEQSHQLPGIIEQEMALLDATAAADARVELVAAPGVRLLGTDASHSRGTGERLIVPLGTLFDGQARELLVRAHVDHDGREGSKVLASVRLHFKDPAHGGLERVSEHVLKATLTDDPRLVAEHERSKTQTLIAMREASRWTQVAARQLDDGDLESAQVELTRAEQRLREREQRASTPEERRRVQETAARISAQRSGIEQAKSKRGSARKAASRALSLESNDEAMNALGY